ncbi:hypothetical protein JKP88DRAFT_146432, partial [Tribonema minus]
MDLHGLTLPLAHCAVRVALRELDRAATAAAAATPGTPLPLPDLVVITGRGRGSDSAVGPVLRPEVQRMLTEEFYPPLGSVTAPANPGRLVVPAADVTAWAVHNLRERSRLISHVGAALR